MRKLIFLFAKISLLFWNRYSFSYIVLGNRKCFNRVHSCTHTNSNNLIFKPSEYIEPELRVTSARSRILRECLSGFVVSLTTLPPSISYANTIGIHPLSGVYSSVIMGLLMSVFAGNGLIAGAAGVITIPITKLVNSHGISYMTSAIFLAGIFEIIFGILKLGKLARYVKKPILAGFSNAFAIFLVKSQMKVFMIGNKWLPWNQLFPPLSIALVCIACIKLLPKIGMIPSSLVGLIISSAFAYFTGINFKTLSDISGPQAFSGGLKTIPPFQGILPNVPYNLKTLKIIFPTAFAISLVSIIATSLVSRIACEAKPPQYLFASNSQFAGFTIPVLCPTELRDDTVVGLGLGNIITSFFGGFGGCGLIPNTVLNTYNGGNSYISSVAYSISTAICVLLLAPVIGRIPVAALAGKIIILLSESCILIIIVFSITSIRFVFVGVMINVAISTFKTEDTIRIIQRGNRSTQDLLDLIGLVVSSVLCLQVIT